MSTASNSFDSALDFMPATAATGGKGPLHALKAFFGGLSEGLEAERLYRHNVAHGMTPSDAASRAFETVFKSR